MAKEEEGYEPGRHRRKDRRSFFPVRHLHFFPREKKETFPFFPFFPPQANNQWERTEGREEEKKGASNEGGNKLFTRRGKKGRNNQPPKKKGKPQKNRFRFSLFFSLPRKKKSVSSSVEGEEAFSSSSTLSILPSSSGQQKREQRVMEAQCGFSPRAMRKKKPEENFSQHSFIVSPPMNFC